MFPLPTTLTDDQQIKTALHETENVGVSPENERKTMRSSVKMKMSLFVFYLTCFRLMHSTPRILTSSICRHISDFKYLFFRDKNCCEFSERSFVAARVKRNGSFPNLKYRTFLKINSLISSDKNSFKIYDYCRKFLFGFDDLLMSKKMYQYV